ncbi:MaoC/PaaZ C-terminal domain-containing protein [Umezawaea beigongshangensis]|uniref:MaoC/PaaZ C-terminal domain-containing protein n=1 Tax=Umezawaea beigongshangensis TaxID=2780383 RepID=UPI0018F16DE3|nr:MaoC/PaaZ C-terminal domain-containing protein [Umezawaea beigongshangensis]
MSAVNLALLHARAGLTAFAKRGGDLPGTERTLSGVTADRAHLAAYDRVCGFRLRDELPVTYPHVLGFTQQLALMTARDFPFALPGLVHVGNRVEWTRPLRADDVLTLRVRARDARPHERGTQFDVITAVEAGGEAVWTGTSTYLKRGSGAGSGSGERERSAPPTPAAVWRVPGDTGRRYADVSGDRNPIHLHALTARAFGFPRAIAHGMWSAARCLAALEGRLPDAGSVAVNFKAPVLLPAEVAFDARADGGTWHFGLRDARSGKPHLDGVVTSA